MIALARVSATLTLESVPATRHLSSSLALAVNSWTVQQAAISQMVSATAMMASASVRWATLVRSASYPLAAQPTLSTLQRPTGGQYGTNLAGLHVHKVSCCMHSSVDCAMPCRALTLVVVLRAAKETPTFTRSGTATMTSGGTTHSIVLDGPSVCQTITLQDYTVAASRCTASRWPSAAHSRKLDGLSVEPLSGALLSTTSGGQGWEMQAAMLSLQAFSVAKDIQSRQSTPHLTVALSVDIS